MPQQNLPAWELTRRQYFLLKTTKFYPVRKGSRGQEVETFPSFRIEGFSQRVFCYSEAWDFCGYHHEIGHLPSIQRQMLRTGRVPEYLSAKNFVEYQFAWKRFFREHPELQTEEALKI